MFSQYCADYFARSPVLAFPMLALGIFLAVFLAVTLRTVFTNRTEIDHMAALPLSDSEEKHHV